MADLDRKPGNEKHFPAPPIVCYQRVKNLQEMLVRARLPAASTRTSSRIQANKAGFKPCRRPKCAVCDQLHDKSKVIKSIHSSATGEEIPIKGNLTCTSTNIVYCITCRKGGPGCPDHPQYIGESGKSLVERFKGHRGTVIQKGQVDTTAPVGVHFRQPGHSIHDLDIVPLEKIRQKDGLLRKTRESFYIEKFNSVNKGLNKKF